MANAENTKASAADNGEARLWQRWLRTFLLTAAILGAALYAGVVLIDPFSTGRFALSQNIDIASRNPRLFKGGVARDPRFDAALFGSSTGYPLDPQKIGDSTGWTMAQLAIPATLPPSQLMVARTFQRTRVGRANLQIHVLDHLWCRPGDPNAGGWGAFPDWIYESSDAEYLSRIFFPEGITTAARRVAIRAGLTAPSSRADGFVDTKLTPMPRAAFAALVRPAANPATDESFPALELLARHIASLPENVGLALVFAPPFINTLPLAGSAADERLQACKARARQIAAQVPNSVYLDLMDENAITRDAGNYFDELHYTPAAADAVAAAIVTLLKGHNLVKRQLALPRHGRARPGHPA
jgi:hypothetical protein